MTPEQTEQLRQISHDVKSPLTVIVMGLEALGMIVDEGSEEMELVRMIQNDGIEPLRLKVQELLEAAQA